MPADTKWFARLVVASAVVNCLRALDLSYPTAGIADLMNLAKARRQLTSE